MSPPLHPFLVHFPLALLPFGLLCEAAALISKREELSRVGWWSQLGGTVGLLLAVTSGLLSKGALVNMPQAQETLDAHEQLAFVSAVVFSVLLFWRLATKTRVPQGRQKSYLLLFAAGVLLVLAAGWFGGELVFRFGIGRYS